MSFNRQVYLRIKYLIYQSNFLIWCAYFATKFFASFFWMVAMTKFEVSYAYPFKSHICFYDGCQRCFFE